MSNVKAFLKKYSSVSNEFVDDFFSVYDADTNPSDFVVDLEVVARWLQTSKSNLKKTLKHTYTPHIDYHASMPPHGTLKRGFASQERIMLTADCFKTLCMMSRTPKASEVRAYFITVERTLFKYRDEIMDSLNKQIGLLQRNQRSKADRPARGGVIYVIRASTTMDSTYKIGKSVDLATRLRSHSSASADALEVVYIYMTNCIDKVESCMKLMMKERQWRSRKKVYKIDLALLKKVIDGCDHACLEPIFRRAKPTTHTGGYYAVVVPSDEKM